MLLAGSYTPAAQAQAGSRREAAALDLQVDATDLDHRIFRVRERIPVTAGRLRLLYPQWIPGHHSPTGRVASLAGLQMTAGSQQLAWRRDPLDSFAFEVDVPKGVDWLELSFQHLSPVTSESGRVVMTPVMSNIQWNDLLLYPAGRADREIAVRSALRLPEGWQFATALGKGGADTAGIRFDAVSLETLIDSPVFAGRYFAQFDLDPGAASAGRSPVLLDVVADNPEGLVISPEALAAHRSLVTQADRLFGVRHFAHYDFLLAISREMSGIGLEHHQSSENGVDWAYFVDWAKPAAGRDLLPHEFTHSWNGKFRRPADLATPNPNTPMQDTLLWMYEGQTQFWGRVLGARSGLVPIAETLDALANSAAWVQTRSGREWRDLQDTTNEPIIGSQGRHLDWPDWQREADYYDESSFIWLEADMRIRDATAGARSLDDFARHFLGSRADRAASDFRPVTYRFGEIVTALQTVSPDDWAGFLEARLGRHDSQAVLEGLRRAGWQLAWSDKPNGIARERSERQHAEDFVYSLGFEVGRDAKLRSVRWNSPAFAAGLVRSLQLIAVDGMAYDPDRLRKSITAAQTSRAPIQLLVRDADRFRTVSVTYTDGLRYPKLERIDGTEDRLSVLLAPKS